LGKTQADFRRDINPRDQFGRKWSACSEIGTGEPTGGIFPAGWTDPLRTPIKYLGVPKNDDGQAEIGKLRVDFDRWVSDQRKEEQDWYASLYQIALNKNVDIPSDVSVLEKHPILKGLAGPKPWPPVEAIDAAKSGDRRLLGFEPLTKVERTLLSALTLEDMKTPTTPTTETYQEFVSRAMASGMVPPGDLKAAAALWQEHRKAA
jgi:hypothetical protein